MRYYGIVQKGLTEKALYNFVKTKCYIMHYTTINSEKRKRRKYYYRNEFIEPFHLIDKDNSIPEGKYYKPICIITSDLVLREKIPQLKSGLIKLLKKYYSHKFIGGHKSIDEVLESIEDMDSTLLSWYDWIEIGRFDFEEKSKLKNLVSYFDIYIRNVNSSYLSVEFHLYLADMYCHNQMQIINSNYTDSKGYAVSGFMQNSKISGGKKIYNICHYNNAALKNDKIYENISLLKWEFYHVIQRYFSTVLHAKGIVPPSINVYKTNISYADKEANYFWESVGLLGYQGQFIDGSRKLFFRNSLSGRYKDTQNNDLTYVVNDESIQHESGYYSFDFQTVHELLPTLCGDAFKFSLLGALNHAAAKELVSYKLTLNKIKLQKRRLRELLKLRYLFEKDMDYYSRYINDDIWEKAQRGVADVFDNKKLKRCYDYRILTDSAIAGKNKILEQIKVLCDEFDAKINILQHLAAYKNESRNGRINFIMLIISVATLSLVIFPEWSKIVATILEGIWAFILRFFS